MSLMISYFVLSVNLARFVAMIQQRSMTASSPLTRDNMETEKRVNRGRERETARGFKGRM